MKDPKKLLMVIAILLLLISACVGAFAYLTDADRATNTLTVGGVNVGIVEEFDPPKEIVPGVAFTKDVKVQNNGPSNCYVRIKAVFTDSDMEKYCSVDWNTSDFVYNDEDGYYYYKGELEVGELTKSLFTTVTVSDSIPEAEIKDFDILVYTEAYQSNGFDNYEEAWEHYHRNKPV